MLSFEGLLKDTYFQKNYHYSHDMDQPSLNFYNIPLANAQDQKEGEDISSNKNDKYVILTFDRGYKTTFTKAKPFAIDRRACLHASIVISICSRVTKSISFLVKRIDNK